MKLAAISERKVHEPELDDDCRTALSFAEADALFRAGIKAMNSGDDEASYQIFDRLCRHAHGAPSDFLRAARAARDYSNPARAAKPKGRREHVRFSRDQDANHEGTR